MVGERHNLPAYVPPLIGRELELEALRPLLLGGYGHLLTLTGTGGCGKTRLALALAQEIVESFPDGVWVVELAGLAEPRLVTEAVAAVLGVQAAPDRPLAETLIAVLRTRSVLLVLDNCEHLVEASATLADRLLRGCPTMRILATSRESLQVAGEVTRWVPPLAVPDLERLLPLEDVARSPAVQLFVARARAARSDFVLSESNAATVARVCARLGGLPLALELAAARTRALPIEQLADHLEDIFRLLVGGHRTAPARQQTLRAAFDWSHALLAREEQVTFRRLAVFAGGFELDAAETVCAGDEIAPTEVLDRLTQLVDKSLVVAEERGGRAWYRMLEPLRQYALERLRASDEEEATRQRHAEVYLALVEAAEPRLLRSGQAAWFDRLERNLDNLRAALEWSRAAPERHELGLRLVGALWRFWDGRGHVGEGRRWLAEFLARSHPAGPTPGRAKALFAAGWLAAMQESTEAAGALPAESVAAWCALGDRHGLSWSLWLEGFVRRHRDSDTALRRGQESLALARATGDDVLTPWALFLMAEARRVQGDLDAATRLLEEGRSLSMERADSAGVSFVLRALAQIAARQGDHARATALLKERLVLARHLRDRWNIPDAIEGLAWIASASGRADRAARLYGAGEALREASGTVLLGERQMRRERRLAALRAALGEPRFAAAWGEGRALSQEEAIADALADEAPPVPVAAAVPRRQRQPPDALTRREREVARLVGRGYTDRQIAEALVISVGTAGVHMHHILEKLGLRSRWQVAEWARRKGLGEPSDD
ncbi:MAG: LuxR C-terminal-related transcriptional regulator [Chloroflexota bacterium]|nr:LuxR C-terminal-related transcriptional regulator [Chloroflexota bacterium]